MRFATLERCLIPPRRAHCPPRCPRSSPLPTGRPTSAPSRPRARARSTERSPRTTASRTEAGETDEHDTDELPARRGRLVVGTHRTESVRRRADRVREDQRLAVVRAAAAGPAGAAADPRGVRRRPGLRRPGQRRRRRRARSRRRRDERRRLGQGTGSRSPPRRRARAPGTARSRRVGGVDGRGVVHVPPGEDASGGKVSYAAANLTDGVADTTWRCDGPAIGEKITLRLPEKTSIGEVGLIPGYAKTDDASGDDRYAENNRVTRVRWTIGKTGVEQKMDGSAERPQPAPAPGAEDRRRRGRARDPRGRRRGRATPPRSARSSSRDRLTAASRRCRAPS